MKVEDLHLFLEKMAGSNAFHLTKIYLVFVWFHLLLLLLDHTAYGVSQNIVTHLPGFDGPLPFELETGYVRVDDLYDVQLFYYFVKSERNPSKDPLLVWIPGGPGCSAVSALAFEFGPVLFKIEEYTGDLPKLVLNPHSWTKVANIIFLDAPVGTGFSYSGSVQGSYTGDIKSAKQTYAFIRKWLTGHPEYLSNPLYFGGDSYSGMPVPLMVQDVSDGGKYFEIRFSDTLYGAPGIEAGDTPLLNLKGYILGNPSTDRKTETNAIIPFAHGMGLISDELFESTKRTCGGDYANVDPNNTLCTKNLEAISECTSRINNAHILEPNCALASPRPNNILRQRSSLEENSSNIVFSPPPYPGTECRSYGYMLSYYWANNDGVRKAINIKKGTVDEWIRCRYRLDTKYSLDIKSSIVYHFNLSKRHYRSLIYSGDHDMLVPLWGTQSWIRSLNYAISDEWRPWVVDGQVAGYTRTYANNMTYATVKGGGHTAPEYRPKECFAMFKRWSAEESL